MKQELKDKWIEALESGRYAQGFGALKRGDKFCCLGVLCDVADPEGWNFRDTHPLSLVYDDGDLSGGCLRTDLINMDIQGELIRMNDSGAEKFTAIAQWIDEYIEVTEE